MTKVDVLLDVLTTDDGGESGDLLSSLRDELADIPGLELRDHVSATTPPGTKSGAEIIAVVVGLGASGALLPVLVTALRDWLLRQRPATRIRIKRGDYEFELESTDIPKPVIEALYKRLPARSGQPCSQRCRQRIDLGIPALTLVTTARRVARPRVDPALA